MMHRPKFLNLALALVARAAIVVLSISCEPAVVEDFPGADVEPQLFVEGHVDPALGAEIFVQQTAVLTPGELSPGLPLWIENATVTLTDDISGESLALTRDTLGVYRIESYRVRSERSYILSVSAVGYERVTAVLSPMPTIPITQTFPTFIEGRERDNCSFCVDAYVKRVRVATDSRYAITFGNLTNITFENFGRGGPNGDGQIALENEGTCRLSFGGSFASGNCSDEFDFIEGRISWDITTNLDTLIGHATYIDPGYIDYVDALDINSTEFEIRGQLEYYIQGEIPSNVEGGYGYVRAQHTALIPVERP